MSNGPAPKVYVLLHARCKSYFLLSQKTCIRQWHHKVRVKSHRAKIFDYLGIDLEVLNHGCVSKASKMQTSASVGGCSHVAIPPVATWCYISISTNLLAEIICKNQAASSTYMFPSTMWLQRLDFVTLGIMNISFSKNIHLIAYLYFKGFYMYSLDILI